ncbi:hypothetical protein IJ425_06520 [bacterium]|nr:hypothetical protein [bacterium]
MIQPLMSNRNVSFGNANAKTQNTSQGVQQPIDTASQPQQPKVSIFKRIKKGFLNIAKSFNTVTGVGSGAVRGLTEGAVAATVIGVFGKNCKQGKGQILETAGGILKDLGKSAVAVVKHIPDVITKAPIENVKNLCHSAINGVTKVAKGAKANKLTAAAATLAGVVIFAARTIQGKAQANKANAELDHITNNHH